MEKTRSPLQYVAIGLIRLYQRLLSPLIGQQCRFQPTCSHYAIDAVEEHGAVIGSWLTFKRIIKCHPLNPGGHDPVPRKHQD